MVQWLRRTPRGGMAFCLGVVTMALCSCSTLPAGQSQLKAPALPFVTKETGKLTVERQQFINVWSSTQVIYLAWMKGERIECAQNAACLAALDKIHEEAKAVYLTVEAKLRNPEAELDWENIAKILGLVAKFVL